MIFPNSTLINRKIPKKRFYENTNIKSKTKKRFVEEIDSIVLMNKLSEDTINIKKTKNIEEIFIFKINLKINSPINKIEDLLLIIDRSIPYPILYEIELPDGNRLYKIAHKKRNKVYSNEFVVEIYFTKKVSNKKEFERKLRKTLNSLDLGNVYKKIIRLLAGHEDKIKIEDLVEKEKKKRALEDEIAKLEKKVNKEKQADKQFDIFNKLKHKKKELDEIQ